MLCRSSRDGLITLALVVLLAKPWSAMAGDNTNKAAAEPGQASKVAETDPFVVPDGTIDELQKYIDGLNRIQPSSSLRPEASELHKKRAAGQGLKAAEKILTAQPTVEQAQAAVRFKVAALAVLGRLGDATAQAALEATVDQVEKLGLKEMVREVRLAALANRGGQAAAMPDEQYGEFIQRLKGFLTEGPIDAASATLAAAVAMAAERSNRPALAVAAYRELGNVLAASKDERGTATAAPMLGAARRLELVGKPFVLAGSTLAGKPLDWKKYRNKVVLVNFFATGNGPCREEMPNILQCYKVYHNRGFDVVGISVDHDRKALEDFVEKEKQPWAVLLDRNEARGTDQSMATYYGIFTIPQMILIGRDGKVLALNVRGRQLARNLEELLDPADGAPRANGSKK